MSNGTYIELVEKAASPTLRAVIADGAGTVGKYIFPPDSWGPTVARLREQDDVGRGQYTDVEEEITVDVTGQNAPECYANYAMLEQLLNQAERWYLGERNLNPILLKYSPKNASVSSISNPLIAVVYGPTPGSQVSGLTASPKFNEAGNYYVIEGVRIRFVRQGELLGPLPTTGSGTTERITSGPATENTVLKDLTFTGTAPSARYPMAYRALFSGAGAGANGHILIAKKNGSNNNINVGSAGGLGPSAPFSDFNDSSADPRQGTNVLRFTPASTAVQTTPTITSCNQFQRATCVISLRNNSTTTSFKIRAKFNPSTSSTLTQYSPWEVLDISSTGVRFLVLGPAGLLPNVSYGITLEIQASAASGTMDVNYVAVINDGDPYSQAITFDNGARGPIIRSPLIADDLDVFAMTSPSNEMTDTLETAPNTSHVPTFMALKPIFGFGNVMQVLVCAHEGTTLWHPNNAGAVAQIEHRLYRRLTYLTPQ